MKKVLLTLFMAITTIVAMAQTKTYTDNLIVTIDGESTDPQKTIIIVEHNTDGTYKLALNNFVLGGEIQVGNIVLDGITVTESNGIKCFQTKQDILITAGEGEEEDWLGPALGAIPVSLTGMINAEELYCTIDIDMSETLGQIINVVFGKNFTAVEYTDNLIVTIDGESTEPQETTIIVEQNANGTYKLALNNFVLGDMIQVGNIVLDGITVTESNGIKNFTVNQNIFITAGDGGSEEEEWLGPQLGEVPVNLIGKMDAEMLYCTIDIDMSELLGQIINVVFGEEGKVTSINSINVENSAKVIYDITGRKINEITNAGIYIVNGKKVFVK